MKKQNKYPCPRWEETHSRIDREEGAGGAGLEDFASNKEYEIVPAGEDGFAFIDRNHHPYDRASLDLFASLWGITKDS